MTDELTEYRLKDLTTGIKELTLELKSYIKSNEKRLDTVENSMTELRTTNKNFMWMFGAAITIINIFGNLALKLL